MALIFWPSGCWFVSVSVSVSFPFCFISVDLLFHGEKGFFLENFANWINIYLKLRTNWCHLIFFIVIQISHIQTCMFSILHRFLAIWWPLKLQLSKKRARIMIGCIWIVALSTTIPWALFFQLVPLYQDSDILLCREVWPPGLDGSMYFLIANVFACYLVPMSLISLCYILIWIKVSKRSIPGDSKDAQMDRMQQKSKIKVVKMLIAVVILFVLSWLPLYLIFARIKFGN